MNPQLDVVVIFDGECAFCDRSIKWIMAHDRAARISFSPRKSPAGQRLLAANGFPLEGVESMILLEGTRISTRSTAVLRIAKLLPFPWNAGGTMLLAVPRFIRDGCYNFIASHRHHLSNKCSVPTPEQRRRILE